MLHTMVEEWLNKNSTFIQTLSVKEDAKYHLILEKKGLINPKGFGMIFIQMMTLK